MQKTASPYLLADRMSGCVFTLLGIAAMAGSLAMPRYANQGALWYEAPGLTPGVLALALTICGVLLTLRRPKSAAPVGEEVATPLCGNQTNRGRIAVVAGCCVVYALVLVGRMPFWLATGLFVFSFTLYFEHIIDHDRSKLIRRALVALALAACTAAAITTLFQELFLVRLP